MDFTDLGGKPVNQDLDFSDLGGQKIEQTPPDSSMMDVASYAAMAPFKQPLQATKYMAQNPEKLPNALPMAGIAIGTMAGGLGAPVGAGLGAIGQRMGNIAFGNEAAPTERNFSPREAIGPMVQTALTGLPEVGGVKNAIQNAAQNLGRRSLGFTKGMLNRLKGGVPEANQTAQEMLDQGVIQPFSGAKATLERAEGVAATSGKAVGDALASTGQQALDTNQVSQEIIDQLAPKFQGGAYDAQEQIANEIVDTIGAHGNGPIDFESAQRLKNTLKQMAGNNWNTDKTKASMYQRAYGIVSDALEKSVQESSVSSSLPVMAPGSKSGDPHAIFTYNDKAGPGGTERSIYNVFGDPENPAIKQRGWGSSVPKEDLDKLGIPITGRAPGSERFQPIGLPPSKLSESYLRNKQVYGASQQAIAGLEDKANAEASNSIVSLRGAAIGAGALAAGHVTPALEALGVWEAARRIGAATGSAALNTVNKSMAVQMARKAVLSAVIDRFVHDGSR